MKLLTAFVALLLSLPALAGTIDIDNPYSHPTAAPGVPGVGFLVLTNRAAQADRLLSVESPLARQVEIHQMRMQDGVMQMRALTDGLALPAGKPVRLAPGGLHLMLFGLSALLVEGARVPLTLRFAKAGVVSTELHVQPREAETAEPAHHHHAH